MNLPTKDMVRLQIREDVRNHLEAIISLHNKIKDHEKKLNQGEWFNLQSFCMQGCPDLEELYNQANKICGWNK